MIRLGFFTILFAVLSLSFSTAFASFEMIADFEKISRSTEISRYLESNRLQMLSIEYAKTAECAGKPSDYVIRTYDNIERSCDVWVQVGDCNLDKDRGVSLITNDQTLICR